jgi:hypothetical protein
VERESGVRITSFSSWLEAAEAVVERAVAIGSPILKNSPAYVRSLHYRRVTRQAAEKAFLPVFASRHYPEWHDHPVATGADFQDYLFHFILAIANRKGLIVQIHTGIQEGSGNLLANSNPEHLANLFREYPEVAFDLFHIGYPYRNTWTCAGAHRVAQRFGAGPERVDRHGAGQQDQRLRRGLPVRGRRVRAPAAGPRGRG